MVDNGMSFDLGDEEEDEEIQGGTGTQPSTGEDETETQTESPTRNGTGTLEDESAIQNLIDMQFPKVLENVRVRARLQPDIDSVYAVSRTRLDRIHLIESVVQSNPGVNVEIPSTISRTRTSTTSRLQLHFGASPVRFRSGAKSNTTVVSPNRLPSLFLCTIYGAKAPLYLSLHHVHRTSLRSNYFTNLEVAVIVAAFNFAIFMSGVAAENRLKALRDLNDDERHSYIDKLNSKCIFAGDSGRKLTKEERLRGHRPAKTKVSLTGKHFKTLIASMFEVLEMFGNEDTMNKITQELVKKNPWEKQYHHMETPGNQEPPVDFTKSKFIEKSKVMSQNLYLMFQAAGIKEAYSDAYFEKGTLYHPDDGMLSGANDNISNDLYNASQHVWQSYLKNALAKANRIVGDIFSSAYLGKNHRYVSNKLSKYIYLGVSPDLCILTFFLF